MTNHSPGKRRLVLFTLVVALLTTINIFPYQGIDTHESLFFWAKKYYVDGIYRESIKKLTLLLSILNSDETKLSKKAHLLLGAAYENLKKTKQARTHYSLASQSKDNPVIDEIDLTPLQEYRQYFKKNQKLYSSIPAQ